MYYCCNHKEIEMVHCCKVVENIFKCFASLSVMPFSKLMKRKLVRNLHAIHIDCIHVSH